MNINKKTLLVIFLLSLFRPSFAQTAEDTKDFIVEKVTANSVTSQVNFVIFSDDILKPDADHIAGKTLSDDEFKHMFIFGIEYHQTPDLSSGVWLTKAQFIDVRDISKVSITKTIQESMVTYSIKVYLNGKYYSKEFNESPFVKAQWSYIDSMKIIINDNYDAATKIKKAIIHLGTTYGVKIKDGDLF